MKVDKELIKNIASLSRLELTENEIEMFTKELKEVLDNFSIIDKCKTEGLEPSFQPVELKNHMREDKVKECLSNEDALKNTEQKKDGYFKGPKAV